jgi:hypothetical protein
VETPSMFMDQRINSVKMAILSTAIYSLKATPINVSMSFFTEMGNYILKFT